MKLLKEIAEIMGWRLTGINKQARYVSGDKCICYLTDRNEKTKLYIIKLLKEKMLDDWWEINICAWKEKLPDFPSKTSYSVCARNRTQNGDYQFADSDNEADGIIELFYKIYKVEDIVKLCHEHGVQNCHKCPDIDCGDNMNKLRSKND